MRHLLSRCRIAAFVLASLAVTSPAFGQETCVAGDGHWGGGPPEAVEHWSGGGTQLLAIGEGAVLKLYDTSAPGAPVKLGEVLVGDPVRSIDISPDGMLAAVADHRNHVHLVDISNRAAPVKRGNYTSAGLEQPYGMDIVGNRLYVAVRGVGLRILNIANPAAPVLLGQSNGTVSDYVFDVEVRGNYAYLAQRDDGVQIINISNPATPTVAGAHAASDGAADIRIVGSRAYVTRGSLGVDILDLTNATTPTRVSTFADTSDYLFETDLIGTQHVAVSSFSGTFVYNISTPSAPTLVSQIGNWHYRLATQGNTAYTSASGGTFPSVKILDLTTPASPVQSGDINGDGNSADVRVGNGQAIVASGERGLVVLDVGNPFAPTFSGRMVFPEVDAAVGVVEYVNGFAAAATYDRVHIVDTSTPSNPVEISSIVLPNFQGVADLASRGKRLYVSSGMNGLRAYDLTTPASPQALWQWSSLGVVALRLAIDDQFAYVSDGPTLHVLQLNGSAAPTLIDDLPMASDINKVAAADGFVYVATLVSGVRILDNRVPGAMLEVANINVGQTTAYGIALEGDRLYIAANELTGLLVYDISNPATPQFVEQRNTSGEARKVAVRKGVVALAEYGSGVRTFVCDAAAAERIFRNGFDTP
ncbi:MAG: hypothetical protein WBP11_13560 [Dokdonella sp.]